MRMLGDSRCKLNEIYLATKFWHKGRRASMWNSDNTIRKSKWWLVRLGIWAIQSDRRLLEGYYVSDMYCIIKALNGQEEIACS